MILIEKVSPLARARLSATCAVIAMLMFSTSSPAQSGSAAFGSVYSPTVGSTSTFNVAFNGSQIYGGSCRGGGSQNISAGTISVPTTFNLNGQGQELQLPVTFRSNGTNSAISGSLTFTFTCFSDCTQGTTLPLTIYLSGQSIVASASASPKYYVLSLLYDPPGDHSSSGFSNSVSAGSTTSIFGNFASNTSLTFSGGFLGGATSVTFGSGTSSGNSSSFTTTYQATSGSQLSSTKQAIDHTQDTAFILVDPTFTLMQSGPQSADYIIGPSVDATGNFGSSGTPSDIVYTNVAGFKTPSMIPLAVLKPQVVKSGTTLPGLSFICAHPLPPSQCTQANACGCVASDFAGIAAQDELASDTSQTTPPSSIDSTRFVYLTYEPLSGPPQGGSGAITNTYSISDSTLTGETTSNGKSYSVGYSRGWKLTGPFSIGISATNSLTYSQTQTAGTTNGHSHTATVTLGSDKPGCFEYVDIFEDTIYHTFAYSLPQAPPAACQ